MKDKKLLRIVTASVFAAFTCVCTMLVTIPLAAGGYANLGDVMVIASGVFCGNLYGFLAAAVGSAMADILSGYVIYAPATFLIKGLMAFTVALLIKANAKYTIPIGVFLAEVEMVIGYFLFECILYGAGTATADLAGNSVQGGVCAVIGIILITLLLRNSKIKSYIKGSK